MSLLAVSNLQFFLKFRSLETHPTKINQDETEVFKFCMERSCLKTREKAAKRLISIVNNTHVGQGLGYILYLHAGKCT